MTGEAVKAMIISMLTSWELIYIYIYIYTGNTGYVKKKQKLKIMGAKTQTNIIRSLFLVIPQPSKCRVDALMYILRLGVHTV